MRCVAFLWIALGLGAGAFAQTTQPSVGKIYRNSVVGIEFCPPAGGIASAEISNGEVARFTNAEASWDLRVKPVPLHLGRPLTAPEEGGVLELIQSQLSESNPTAEILSSAVHSEPGVCGGAAYGLIEARFDSATDRVFAQQAIFRDSNNYYVTIQMNSHGKPKSDTSDKPFAEETDAKTLFGQMLKSVHLLDRSALRREQDRRENNTRQFWVGLDEKKIVSALVPLHFTRILRDGKDVGFIQMNERKTVHLGNPGVEVVIHSKVNSDLVQPKEAETSMVAATAHKADKDAPSYFYSSSDYFVTFDRDHEAWTTSTQLDDQVMDQITESANSDVTIRRRLDARKAADNARNPTTHASEPPVVELRSYTLDVAYAKGPHQDKPTDTKLPPYYLPQALGQLLPRLVPTEPAQYLFAFYVSGSRNVLRRYIDVGGMTDVELDGDKVRGIAIGDRIGVDSSPTVHYVSASGEWLGSVNEELKLEMLPTDEATLKGLWPGFAVSPEPPLEVDETATHKRRMLEDKFDLQNSKP